MHVSSAFDGIEYGVAGGGSGDDGRRSSHVKNVGTEHWGLALKVS